MKFAKVTKAAITASTIVIVGAAIMALPGYYGGIATKTLIYIGLASA